MESQQRVLDRFVLGLGVLIYLMSSKIGNLQQDINDKWFVYQYLLMMSFILVLLSLRKEAINLFTIYGYRIMMYGLINFYIDTYCEIDSWSWNDFLTVILIGIEAVFATIKRIKNERR
jgi:hypothetical protein